MSEAYRIYYENEEELSTKEPGVEISLQKDIVWENKNSRCEQWKALSVFVFPHGLVLELAKQVTPEQYLAFYEKWKDVDEEQITDRQREQIEAESPLGECPTVLLTCNGKELQSDWTRGMGWYPSDILEKLEEKQDQEAEACQRHYGLDPAYIWWIGRFYFRWKQPVNASEIQNFVLTLQAEKNESMERKVLFCTQAIRSSFYIRSQGRPTGWMLWKLQRKKCRWNRCRTMRAVIRGLFRLCFTN